MKLKFVPNGDQLVREAGITPRIGEATRYYGRLFDAEKRAYPAKDQPFEVDSEGEDGPKCMKACRKAALFAADSATASACGVSFVPVEFSGGAWIAAAPKKSAAKAEKGS